MRSNRRRVNESTYTINYVDNTGANFSSKVRAKNPEEAERKFREISKTYRNGVRKIKGEPFIAWPEDDDEYN